MHIHEELALDVFRRKATEAEKENISHVLLDLYSMLVVVCEGRYLLYFVEYNARRLVDLVEAHNGSCHGEAEGYHEVGAWQEEDIMVFDTV